MKITWSGFTDPKTGCAYLIGEAIAAGIKLRYVKLMYTSTARVVSVGHFMQAMEYIENTLIGHKRRLIGNTLAGQIDQTTEVALKQLADAKELIIAVLQAQFYSNDSGNWFTTRKEEYDELGEDGMIAYVLNHPLLNVTKKYRQLRIAPDLHNIAFQTMFSFFRIVAEEFGGCRIEICPQRHDLIVAQPKSKDTEITPITIDGHVVYIDMLPEPIPSIGFSAIYSNTAAKAIFRLNHQVVPSLFKMTADAYPYDSVGQSFNVILVEKRLNSYYEEAMKTYDPKIFKLQQSA